MKKTVYGFGVVTDVENDIVLITQENQYAQEGEDVIQLNPCQIDLLIKLLTHAKEVFSVVGKHTLTNLVVSGRSK